MEYLVTMTTHVPDGTPDQAVDDIRARETARSRELAAAGHLSAGVWTLCETWGFLPKSRARYAVALASAGVFFLLAGLGLKSLSAFRLPL